jgi:hypothetical protein
MALICDTGPIYALYDADDAHHARVKARSPDPCSSPWSCWLRSITCSTSDSVSMRPSIFSKASRRDDYRVRAFNQPIETTKATAIYNMHVYWSKKPHTAIRQYIQHYTRSGDIVLDPFCGSGGTALAALLDGRKAIAIDRSPAATFITKNHCTPVDPEALREAFELVKRQIQPEIDWLTRPVATAAAAGRRLDTRYIARFSSARGAWRRSRSTIAAMTKRRPRTGNQRPSRSARTVRPRAIPRSSVPWVRNSATHP